MLNQAFFKRIIPFVLTFALGLFVASFFVSILPTVNFNKFRKNRCGKRHEVRMLRYENERLEIENQRLKQRLEESEKIFLLEAPVPPPPPRVVEMPMDSVPAAPRAR